MLHCTIFVSFEFFGQVVRVLFDVVDFVIFIIVAVVNQMLSNEERNGIGALSLHFLLRGKAAIKKCLYAWLIVFDKIFMIK